MTLQSVRRERSQQVSPQARRRPCHQPKRGRPSNLGLQNLPSITQLGRRADQILGGTPPQRIHPRVKVSLCGPLLLHQEEGRKAPTSPRLLKIKRTNHPRQLPAPPDQNDPGTTPRSIALHQVRHTLGIQQHQNQGGRRMESRLQNPERAIRTTGHVLRTDQLPRNLPTNDEPNV